MKDTSEFPDGIEQVKPATSRSRANARSKPESATQGSQSQEQAVRATVQRRTTSSTGMASAARSQSTTGNASSPSASAAQAPSANRSRSTTSNASSPLAPAARPTSTQRPAAHPQGTPLQAPAQRQSGTAPMQRSASSGGTLVQRPVTPSSRP